MSIEEEADQLIKALEANGFQVDRKALIEQLRVIREVRAEAAAPRCPTCGQEIR